MPCSIRLLSLTFLAVFVLTATVDGQEKPIVRRAPVLIRNTAAAIAPGLSIELEAFYPDGLPEVSTEVRFVFQQPGKKLTVLPGGSCGELETRTQTFNVTAPESLVPGICQVVMQIGQQESQPVALEVGGSVAPPVVTSDYAQVTSVPQYPPRPAQPGDIAVVDGTNFSPSDQVEIVDARGVVYRVPANSGSSAESTGFTVPENIADGEATFEIIEQRSGTQQRSKKVPLQILNVPLPLEISPDGLRPVAPGQWLDVGVEDTSRYGQPKQVEVAFVQNGKAESVELNLELNDELHLQVPRWLLPGDAVVRTRTRRDGRVSEWSQPARYELLEHPATPFVESLQPIRKNEPGKSEPLIYLEGDRSPVLTAEPGDRIAVRGHFPVESTSSVRIKLVSTASNVLIKPTETGLTYSSYFEVELPRDLGAGEWQVYICEVEYGTSARLMITLGVRRGR